MKSKKRREDLNTKKIMTLSSSKVTIYIPNLKSIPMLIKSMLKVRGSTFKNIHLHCIQMK